MPAVANAAHPETARTAKAGAPSPAAAARPASTELALLETKAVAVPAGAAKAPATGSDVPAAAPSDDREEWDGFREAPTVVDLMAWEVRARVAAEDERERKARSDVAPADEAPVGSDVPAGSAKKQARKGA